MSSRIAYIGGTFEIPHIGHANLIRRVKEMGFYPVIAVNGDEFVKENRGYYPLLNEDRRAGLFRQYGAEALVVPRMSAQQKMLELIRPEVVVLGTDWEGRDVHKQFCVPPDWFREQGIRLLYLPRTEGVSSSFLKELLKE